MLITTINFSFVEVLNIQIMDQTMNKNSVLCVAV